MRHFSLAAAAAMLAFSGAVGTPTETKAQERVMPHTLTKVGGFTQQLQSAGQFEIESSVIALNKTHNEAIRSFAQKMIDDHTAAQTKVSDLLKQEKIKAPQYAITAADRELVFKLITLDGNAFDRQYVSDQIKGHEDTVKLLTNYSEEGDNDALKHLASELLPTIKEHLQMAEGLRTSVTAKR